MSSKVCNLFAITMLYEFATSANSCHTVPIICDDFVIILEHDALKLLIKFDFNGIFIANILRFIFALFRIFSVLFEIFWMYSLVKRVNCINTSASI